MTEPALADRIANELRRSILRGELVPGAPIKERDHATVMGVSRTPMREAIRILAKEGLVELSPARSPIVSKPTAKDLCDQAAVLVALEKLSGELACDHATDTDLGRIREAARRMEETFYTAERIDSFEMDMAFHTTIAEASRNAALARTHKAYLARLWHARYLTSRMRMNRERVLTQHNDILDAILHRDKPALSAAFDAHLGHLPQDLENLMASQSQDKTTPARTGGKETNETA
ncbi:transcriptional regulator, GntR family [Roseovarius azorensis]|uniref:Transcriptional regulator, GntR family n=1 Tax=Roseovarius azorensis TaxID=1287727 RepID=A0A1H7UYY9_9RHOB|nr:GntR family transcriptional regulator [Roseovarius azorensis]SEM01999.1 transcriptional regulator, GntR family [Roseovarius azorensis]